MDNKSLSILVQAATCWLAWWAPSVVVLGLSLGTESSVMMTNSIHFSFLFFLVVLTFEDSIAGPLQGRGALQGCQHINQAVLSALAHFRPAVCAVPQQQREGPQCWRPLCRVDCCCDVAQASQSCSESASLHRGKEGRSQHLMLLVSFCRKV